MDVFLSANQEWMDRLEASARIAAGSRTDLLSNRLVLIAPAGAPLDFDIASDLRPEERFAAVRRVAIADSSHVPAGIYAKQALEALGWWESLEAMMAPALDVRAALRLVEIGEADLGIVYATDALASSGVAIVMIFPADLHETVRYPVAQCSDSSTAAEFIAFLRSPEMRGVFEEAGFRVLTGQENAEGRRGRGG